MSLAREIVHREARGQQRLRLTAALKNLAEKGSAAFDPSKSGTVFHSPPRLSSYPQIQQYVEHSYPIHSREIHCLCSGAMILPCTTHVSLSKPTSAPGTPRKSSKTWRERLLCSSNLEFGRYCGYLLRANTLNWISTPTCALAALS